VFALGLAFSFGCDACSMKDAEISGRSCSLYMAVIGIERMESFLGDLASTGTDSIFALQIELEQSRRCRRRSAGQGACDQQHTAVPGVSDVTHVECLCCSWSPRGRTLSTLCFICLCVCVCIYFSQCMYLWCV
jgi:hypothetical protein